jgi:Mor family transcriptional regulator
MTAHRSDSEDKAAELKFELTNIVSEEIGMNEAFASQIAEALVRGLRKRMGGQDIYIPAPNKSARDAAIKAEFNGRNLDALCDKYQLGRSAIYKIVNQK